MRRFLILLIVGSLCACSSSPEKPDETKAENPEPPNLEDSECLGNRVPPTNYRQVTVFEPIDTPNAFEVAKNKAVRQLRDRVCQGYRCNAIEPKISLWHSEADAIQACAMAVVKASDVAAFEQAPRAVLKANLEKTAAALVQASGAERPIFALDAVRDNGVEGGNRAEWLVDRMSAALTKSGAALGKVPSDWTGMNPPDGADAVLRGRITRMHGREAMLEVTWQLDDGKALRSVDPIIFPEFIGPVVDESTLFDEVAPTSDDVALRFAARPGGGLCNGDTFHIFLETSKPLHVRVLNLYGNGDEGLTIWSSRKPVQPGKAIDLGEFQAIAGEVPAERFVVLAAGDETKLDGLAEVKTPCRLPRDFATRIASADIPGGVAAASRGYRIVDSSDCPKRNLPEADMSQIAKLPLCY